MRKFNKDRQAGARKNVQARWQGVAKILSLCTRAEHTQNVAPVVNSFYAVDILVSTKGL